MRADLVDCLDALWAAHLGCQRADLRSQTTVILSDPARHGAAVWLFGRTCVIAAAPAVAEALRRAVGTRSPLQAFEPGRLRSAVADFWLAAHGPEAVLAAEQPGLDYGDLATVYWIAPSETESDIRSALDRAAGRGVPAMSVSLGQRAARRAAEACGFELYAMVVYLGERACP